MDDFPSPQSLTWPPLHGDLGGQPAQVSHSIWIRCIVQCPGSLPYQLHARFTGADERVCRHLYGKELLAQEREFDEVEKLLEVGLPLDKVVLSPVDESSEHGLFSFWEVEIVAAQKVLHSSIGNENKTFIL